VPRAIPFTNTACSFREDIYAALFGGALLSAVSLLRLGRAYQAILLGGAAFLKRHYMPGLDFALGPVVLTYMVLGMVLPIHMRLRWPWRVW